MKLTDRAEETLIVPLPKLQIGAKGTVAHVRTQDREALQKLIAMGILPMTDLALLQRYPTLVLQIGRSQFAVDEELGSHVFVRPDQEPVAINSAGCRRAGRPATASVRVPTGR